MNVSLKTFLVLSILILALQACGSDAKDAAGDGDAEEDVFEHEDVPDGDDQPPDGDLEADGDDVEQPDGDTDSGEAFDTEESEAEAEEESPPEGLPTKLPFTFTRENPGDPIPADEVTAFTRRLTGLMAKAQYHDWVLRSSHGVHPSTGLRDFMLYWTGTHAEKSGDTVSFVHNETSSPTSADGGHNLMTRSSKILASAIAGYLMSGDTAMAAVAEQYCKGVTSTMLGMVYDDKDELHHLMARNVVTFNHGYTTHDGRKKEVDYSNWFHDGAGWNCHRFEYAENPYWGSVWVTNMRSKDDISRLLRVTAVIRYASEQAADEAVREACGEAHSYLKLFAKDIVDSGYYIRSKDKNGEVFIPGQTGDTEADNAAGDLASYVDWEMFIPNAECNPKRAAALIAYEDGLDNDCGDAGGNQYEEIAVRNHYFNIWLIRSTHISHVMQALTHRDNQAARQSLQGLVTRYTRDVAYDAVEQLEHDQDSWDRDVAASLMQAVAVGYPLNGEEARLVYKYYERAIEKFSTWPHWDLWDEEIPDGSYEYRPPDSELVEEQRSHWIRVEDLGAFLDACWSPFVNPDGIKLLDCELVRDPSQWDASWLEE